MRDSELQENDVSHSDEAEVYRPVEFDPECTVGDEDGDGDLMAFRDAMRDIWQSEGRFEVLMV